MNTSISEQSQTRSPHSLHLSWIREDMNLNDVDEMRAYDLAQYLLNQDSSKTENQ
jgi:hypothetical protein